MVVLLLYIPPLAGEGVAAAAADVVACCGSTNASTGHDAAAIAA
jgi:hypothetical protein